MHDGKRIFGPRASLLALILLDICVLAVSAACVVTLRYVFGGGFSLHLYLGLSWMFLLYSCIAGSMGVYPGYLRTPPEELKLLSWSTSLFFLIISSLTFLSRGADQYSRLIFLCSWLLALVTVPSARILARRWFGRYFSWGYPCVLIGGSEGVGCVLENIRRDRRQGLWPLAVMTETGAPVSGEEHLPAVSFEALPLIAADHPHCHAILIFSTERDSPEPDVIEQLSFHFKHVLLSSAKVSQLSLWVRGVDVGGGTFLKTYFKLLDPNRMRLKRLFDIVLCAFGSIVALPVTGLIALCIKLDSPGPVFFRQTRLGQGGKEFQIFKFRTMRCDAQACLDSMLAEDPELAAEWKKNQKLERDPRITRVGRFLRCTSLDELPQFFNVIRGEMSLVGPRPIVAGEIEKYGKEFVVYKRLKPGISGLWQVSGRNRTSYERRVGMDVYYARNWSVWMDIWILAKTVQEIIQRGGI
ncbi:Undecaprenyl-phosphate galactose phosphotransferase, WbaP [Desulfovibrio sp. X2]|uniref:undecaprenyl-phosphate galactose phosphotransferase WbaP n=1 Tax=Desulfovibrio sp. X2 TaxID=941449 RepID=UPI000358CEB3|nr:undecaprenyl-phosphate galactose phosphotransferase WbaP [Desulfovibrio sp. X2]EPR37177.1 Undecaprenyl-phosphate galactose phosphotransferase, WbaP [Desulfovibrio sp. X2]